MDGKEEKVNIRTVGIVGYGNFGAFAHQLLRRFAPHISVRVYEPKRTRDATLFFNLKEVAECDAVILAVPIRSFQSVVKKLIPHLKPTSVLVDVSTVKAHTSKILKEWAPGRFISTHPMWGPESYRKRGGDVSGFRIVIAGHNLPSAMLNKLGATLERVGFNVLHMDADTHDKNLAETLFLTHFVGQIIAKAGFVRTDIDTVSFGYLMDAVESVRADKALFRDVFLYNPYCMKVLKKFASAEVSVRKLLK